MAYWQIKNVALRGVTGTVPDRPVRTEEFPFFTKEEAVAEMPSTTCTAKAYTR